MKFLTAALLCIALLLTLAGCAPAGPSISADLGISRQPDGAESSDTPCDIVFEELASGGGIAEQLLKDSESAGIMQEVLASLGYKVVGQEELENGAIRYLLEITAIDMKALLEDLSSDLSSKEEAREALLEMLEDAERKTFEAELTVIPTETEGKYEFEYGRDFLNAITGGMIDLIAEAFDLEVAE